MARGLRIESYGIPEVDERPLNGPTLPTEQPIDNFGGGQAAAEAHAQVGGVLREVQQNAQEKYQQEYKNAIQLQGLELANQLTQEETRAKNALAQVKGKDALAAAWEELKLAIEADPNNPLALREMGSNLLMQNNYELARTFYVRAVQADPSDKVAMGYLGCTLMRLNRASEATGFLNRAGAGPWSNCTPVAPTASNGIVRP
jgi:tetratricopeptide (TPR) repeat protein